MGTLLQMRGVSTGGVENLATIDVPMNGEILGVEWNYRLIYDTTADQISFQLSFGSTYADVNDSRQVISNCLSGQFTSISAVGVVVGGDNFHHPIPQVPVSMGERLFLHSSAAAGVVAVCFALVEFSFDLDKVQARRR